MSGFLLLNFLLRAIFSSEKSFIIFSAIDVSYRIIISSWLYPNFFLNSVASGNLQCSIISRVSFSIIKIPDSPSKNALYFCFSSFVMSFVFLPQYFLILLNATYAIFEWLIYAPTSLIFCHNSFMSFFIIILNCLNTTFSPCFFCYLQHFYMYKENFFF